MTGATPTRRKFLRGAALVTVGVGTPWARVARAETANTADGVKLYYATTGKGPAIIFLHEAARTHRSFDLQLAALKHNFQCIVYSARGYPPSDVPASLAAYSQDLAAADTGAVLDALELKAAHVVGVSMGSAAALQFALRNPSRVRSITLCSVGAGSDLKPGEFATNIETTAAKIEVSEASKLAEILGSPPDRQRLKQKRPAEFQKFMDEAAGLSPVGLANAYRGVVKPRPPIYALKDAAAAMGIPTLVIVGELDAPCLKPSRFLVDTISGARLEVLPATGHSVNIEEPEIVNRLVADFVTGVEAKRSSK